MDSIEIKPTHLMVLVFGLGILVGFGAGVVAPMDPSEDGDKQQEKDTTKTIQIDEEPMKGSEDAEVGVIIYEDYQCPFCRRFEERAYTQIVEEYVDSGEVRLIWKDYPLTSRHPWAGPVAEAMECVSREDEEAFWKVKKKIFDNQNSLNTDNAVNRTLEWAEAEGVQRGSVRTCIENGEAVSEIQNDMREGGRLGTPTVFVGSLENGEVISSSKISGAQPFSRYKSAIESELNS